MIDDHVNRYFLRSGPRTLSRAVSRIRGNATEFAAPGCATLRCPLSWLSRRHQRRRFTDKPFPVSRPCRANHARIDATAAFIVVRAELTLTAMRSVPVNPLCWMPRQ
jgi:hypothetical protein